MATSYIVLGLYLVMLLGLGVAGLLKSRKAVDAEADYYLAGRGQGLLVTSLTIMATYFSGFAILSFPGWVYGSGIPPMLLALNLPVAAMGIYIIGNRLRKLGRARGYVTPADLLSDYYGGSGLVRFLVALIGALYVIPYVVMQIKAGGLLAEGLFGNEKPLQLFGMELTIYDSGVAALSFVTMAYVLLGGMRSVAWTDVIQGVLLLSAMLLSGVAIMNALGGVSAYFDKVSSLDGELLTMPAYGQKFNPLIAMTFCMFASLASIVQPGQWMRFYAARDSKTLRNTAVVFATVLPLCFLFGVFLVGLGGRALYPMGADGSMPEVLSKADQIVILVISEQFPQMFGAIGVVLVSLVLVAVMAASMSTADSNLHALSAVVTRDVYARARPESGDSERAWVGRVVIVLATVAAAAITYLGKDTNLFDTIAKFFLMAMAFSAQLLPATVDVLFLRRGTRAGAAAGMIAGLLTVALFPPLGTLLLGEENAITIFTGDVKMLLDTGLCGIIVNASVFALVSKFTAKSDPEHVHKFAEDLS